MINQRPPSTLQTIASAAISIMSPLGIVSTFRCRLSSKPMVEMIWLKAKGKIDMMSVEENEPNAGILVPGIRAE
jgi:hypothetical protein